jgi:hypothetical protein
MPVSILPHLVEEKKFGGTAEVGRSEGDVIGKILDQSNGKINDQGYMGI